MFRAHTESKDQRVSCVHLINGPAGFVLALQSYMLARFWTEQRTVSHTLRAPSYLGQTLTLQRSWPQRQPTQRPTAPKAVCLHVCPACLHLCRRGRCAAFEGPSPPARLLADVWGCFPAGLALVFFPAGLALVFAFLCAFGASCAWSCATANIRNSCTNVVQSVGLVSRTVDDESVKSSSKSTSSKKLLVGMSSEIHVSPSMYRSNLTRDGHLWLRLALANQ